MKRTKVLRLRGLPVHPKPQVSEYMRVIEDQNNHVPEMNRVLEPRNPTMLASSYEAPAFNLLRLELEWALEMVTQLKAKGRVSGAKDLLYQLQGQVRGQVKGSLPFCSLLSFPISSI